MAEVPADEEGRRAGAGEHRTRRMLSDMRMMLLRRQTGHYGEPAPQPKERAAVHRAAVGRVEQDPGAVPSRTEPVREDAHLIKQRLAGMSLERLDCSEGALEALSAYMQRLTVRRHGPGQAFLRR